MCALHCPQASFFFLSFFPANEYKMFTLFRISRITLHEIFSSFFLFLFIFRLMTTYLHVQYYATSRYTYVAFLVGNKV